VNQAPGRDLGAALKGDEPPISWRFHRPDGTIECLLNGSLASLWIGAHQRAQSRTRGQVRPLLAQRKWRNIPVIATLLVAALLRLWNLDATEFKYDEARVANLAAQFVDTGIPPLRGMGSSAGIDNPPLAVYLISLPVLVTRDPLFVTAFVVLLNLAGVWGCYALGRRQWGAGVGLVASALLAVSPWAVFYTRKIWAQDLLLPFVVLFFALLLAWAVDGRRWALSSAVLALAALTQIHFAALALIPVFGVSYLLALLLRPTYRPFAWWGWPLLLGMGGSALLYAPYVIFDARQGWRNVLALVETLRGPAVLSWNAARYALLNVGGREIHALAGPQRFREFLAAIPSLGYWPDRIEEGLVVGCTAYLVIRMWRRRHDRQQLVRDSVLLLWLVGPTLFFLRSRSPVYTHYLIPLYPAPYLVLSIGAADLLRGVRLHQRLRQPVYAAAGLLGATLVVWQVGLSLSIYAFVETHDTPNGAGTPVGILRRVSSTIRTHATTWSSGHAIVYCAGDDPALAECPAVLDFMAGHTTNLRFVDYDASLLFPGTQGDRLVVLAPGESRAADVLPAYAELLANDTVWLRERAGAYRFYRLPTGSVPQAAVLPPGAPAELENGVHLLGYDLRPPVTPGQTTRLTLYWRVAALPPDVPEQGYRFANHVLASSGQRVGQHDGPGYPVERWRGGDMLASWFDISIASAAAPGPYTLRTGMYVYTPPDQFTPVHVLDEAGRVVADAVEWAIP
jgi:4-amino-4-deoxy-L-arabinose transferase-like glycosyltransferase